MERSTPSPGSRRTMLCIAGGDPTSPRKRGEVKKKRTAVLPGSATMLQTLPPGNAQEAIMAIELHTWNTPNGRKISVALEEMGLPYRVFAINITRGEQMAPD